jgi:hypothetical protein
MVSLLGITDGPIELILVLTLENEVLRAIHVGSTGTGNA